MPSENPSRSFLEERKTAILAELRALAPELIEEYIWIIGALDKGDAVARQELEADDGESDDENIVPTSYEYASIIKPSDAWVRYLSERKAPATRKAIIRDLALGGWGKSGQAKKPKDSMKKMFDYYLGDPKKNRAPKAMSESPVKEVNGLVGLREWPDADFVLKREDGTIVIGEAKNIPRQK